MAKIYQRAFCERAAAEAAPGTPLRFTASTPGVKRDGLDLNPADFLLDNYRRNPVFLWAHDFFGRNLPIGRAEVQIEPDRVVAEVTFDQEDAFARQVESKYRRGFLNAVSISWDNVQDLDRMTHYELLEISGVPVPADPDALIEREREGLLELRRSLDAVFEQGQGVIPPHRALKAALESAWDPTFIGDLDDPAALRAVHAWVNPESDPADVTSYRLPHHNANGEVVWAGVAAAMLRLFAPATQIPEADRRGVYAHLARHYGQFGKQAPEFQTLEYLAALEPGQIRGLFLEGETVLHPSVFPLPDEHFETLLRQLDRVLGDEPGAEMDDDSDLDDDLIMHIKQQLDTILGGDQP